MNQVLEIIKNKTLTYNQQVLQLAGYAGNTIEVFNLDEDTKKLLDEQKNAFIEFNDHQFVIISFDKKAKKVYEKYSSFLKGGGNDTLYQGKIIDRSALKKEDILQTFTE